MLTGRGKCTMQEGTQTEVGATEKLTLQWAVAIRDYTKYMQVVDCFDQLMK